MSDEVEIPSGGGEVKVRPPTPKVIAAQSESWNSFARICIGGGVLLLLCVGMIIAFFKESSLGKDILLVISALGGYMIGRGDRPSKEDK
jgi:hypothetical protein